MSKTTKPDLLGVEPIDYVYRGSDGLIYRTIPQDVPVIETIPRYSAATVERLVQERDGLDRLYALQFNENNDLVGERKALQEQLATITQERDQWKQLAANCELADEQVSSSYQLAASQAREQQLREALEYYASFDYSDDSCPVAEDAQQALAIPQDDTALRQWGAELLKEIERGAGSAYEIMCRVSRKVSELEVGK